MSCRPWGNRGDKKNDGFLKSERRLFQVYAPNEMTEDKAIKKIREDFAGALSHWNVDFDKWVFAHNAGRLPPHVHEEILKLERENQGIRLEPWGFEEFRLVFRRLDRADLESWFGFVAPTAETKTRLAFHDLRVVLESIALQKMNHDRPIRDVPPGKIEANALSESIARLLKEGMSKAALVDEFFSKWRDPFFGEQIAGAFRKKYASCRDLMTPNQIFHEIQVWAGGSERGSAEHELAVLTIMAYYFERCEIFEEPRTDSL